MTRLLHVGLRASLGLALFSLACSAPSSPPAPQATAAAPPAPQNLPPANRPSPEKDQWMQSLSNAGRWGADDQRGAANLVTTEKRMAAFALARTGTVVSLMRPIALTGKSAAIAGDHLPDGNPYYEMRVRVFPPDSRYAGFSSDIQEYAIHGPLVTHVDALCHDSYEGRYYNNVPVADAVNDTAGCAKLDVTTLGDGMITRGVLIDFPRLRGRALQQGERLTPADVEAWEKKVGVTIGAGDAVFLYTGITNGKPDILAGYDLTMMPWFKARDVALISADGPNADHQLSLAALGVNLLDNSELGTLGETAARLNRWEFLFIMAPAAPRGATGATVNPLAVF